MIGRLFHWWSASRSRRRLRRLLNRVRDGSPVRACPGERDRRSYPVATARVRYGLTADAVAKNDVATVRQHFTPPTAGLPDDGDDWEADAAAVVDAACRAATDRPDPAAPEVQAVFNAYCACRRETRSPIPGGYALTARVATTRRDDDDAFAAYLEYLHCGRDRPQPGSDDVVRALQHACRPTHADAERRNTLVRDLRGYPWASWHLMELHRTRGDHRAAAEALARANPGGGPPAEPGWAYRAGLVHRALERWAEALACFQVTAGSAFPEQELANVYRAEAELRCLDQQLLTTPGPRAEAEAAVERCQSELERLATTRGGAVAAAVLIELVARSSPPRAVWGRIASWDRAYPPGLETSVAHRLFDADAATDDVPTDPAGRVRQYLIGGRLAEARAALAEAGADLAAPPPPGPIAWAWADFHTRTGDPVRGTLPASGRPGDHSVAVRIERHLALGQIAEAASVLRGGAGLLLGWVERELYEAEVLTDEGDWSAALDRLSRVLGDLPDSPRVLVAMGFTALTVGEDDLAREAFDRAARLRPQNRYARLGLLLTTNATPDWSAEHPDVAALGRPMAPRLGRAGRVDLVARLQTTAPAGGRE